MSGRKRSVERPQVRPSHEALGQAVADLRAERHLTQVALARRANLDASYLNRIERGKCNPTWTMLWRLSQALDLTLSAFLQRVEQLDSEVSGQ